MIEFDNIEEVLKGMDADAQNQPLEIQELKIGPDTPDARTILESCLATVSDHDNIIVIRFSVTDKPDGKGCQVKGDTQLAVHGEHAATHAVILLEETVSALKEKIIASYMKEKMRDLLNRNDLEGK